MTPDPPPDDAAPAPLRSTASGRVAAEREVEGQLAGGVVVGDGTDPDVAAGHVGERGRLEQVEQLLDGDEVRGAGGSRVLVGGRGVVVEELDQALVQPDGVGQLALDEGQVEVADVRLLHPAERGGELAETFGQVPRRHVEELADGVDARGGDGGSPGRDVGPRDADGGVDLGQRERVVGAGGRVQVQRTVQVTGRGGEAHVEQAVERAVLGQLARGAVRLDEGEMPVVVRIVDRRGEVGGEVEVAVGLDADAEHTDRGRHRRRVGDLGRGVHVDARRRAVGDERHGVADVLPHQGEGEAGVDGERDPAGRREGGLRGVGVGPDGQWHREHLVVERLGGRDRDRQLLVALGEGREGGRDVPGAAVAEIDVLVDHEVVVVDGDGGDERALEELVEEVLEPEHLAGAGRDPGELLGELTDGAELLGPGLDAVRRPVEGGDERVDVVIRDCRQRGWWSGDGERGQHQGEDGDNRHRAPPAHTVDRRTFDHF